MEPKPHKQPYNHHQRERLSLGTPNDTTHCRSSKLRRETTSSSMSDLLPQWGNRKRLRFTKNGKVIGDESSSPVQKTANPRFDRESHLFDSRQITTSTVGGGVGVGNVESGGYFNLRHRNRRTSPPTTHRVLRNTEIMRLQGNGGDQEEKKKKKSHHKHHHNINENGCVGAGSSDFESKKGVGKGGGSSSGSDVVPAVFRHKFVIALTNKEKEEDFLAIKGTKLPQRPKKRSKLIQRTLNAVSPGAFLSDLTLDRYEVKEKKTSKKMRRGLKAMGNKSSDSE